MLHSLYRAGMCAVLLGLLFVPGGAWGGGKKARAHKVDDELNLFSPNAKSEANSIIAQIKEKHNKDLVIETREKGPDKDKASAWAEKRADTLGVDGVYIIISKEPKHFEVFVGNKTEEKRYFTQEDRKHVKKTLSAKLGKKSDEALHEVVTYTRDRMDQHAPVVAQKKEKAPAPGPAHQPVAHHDIREAGVPPWVGWVCLIIGVLFVVWIVFALIRAMTGAMGGGYGPGYGGGGYGGGGGGFFTGMLGGLFGAMAGMWIYNNMFGGHATYGPNGAVNWGGGGAAEGSSAPYEADTGGTAEGGDWGGDEKGAAEGAGAGKGDDGGDWGDKGDDAGGDGGDAAGGDWGGGGDAGGGGGDDGGGGGGWFGGGGGDAGGGGGGDWGGGGGGDFGGGGGGGDW